MPDRPTPPIFDAADEEITRYRAISSLAVAGLLTGLLSPLALAVAALWIMPPLAVAASALALWRIARRPQELSGRPAALIGLLLGTTFLAAAVTDDLVFRRLLRDQARQFAEMWVDAVHCQDVYKAHHLMLEPRRRMSLEARLTDFYNKNLPSQRALKLFVNDPTIRTLFALGPEARIRYYETAAIVRESDFDQVRQIYAVTYTDEQNQAKSFFIALVLHRTVDGTGRAAWTLMHIDGGVRPPGW